MSLSKWSCCNSIVGVVHTEKLPKFASIFVTSVIHKVSYAGQFSYGRNFYAEMQIDNLVCELYGLNEAEIAVVL
jgi:hypothetical protein